MEYLGRVHVSIIYNDVLLNDGRPVTTEAEVGAMGHKLRMPGAPEAGEAGGAPWSLQREASPALRHLDLRPPAPKTLTD